MGGGGRDENKIIRREINRKTRGIRETAFGISASSPTASSFSRGSRGSRFQDWENPLVRCGIALAGASHWSVSDKATSQLMPEFMRRWQAGEPRAMAWREAQLTLLRSKGAKEDFSNPYFWPAFTLTGQWR